MQIAKLTPAEEKLIKAAAEGSVADYRVGQDNDPAQGEQWGEGRTLRAEILCELAAGSTWPVHRKGIQVLGARIIGGFDLEFAQVDRPLEIGYSHFEKPLTLRSASVPALSLGGSYLAGGIVGDAVSVKGSVFLNQGFHATGVVRFPGAEIGGQLKCTGGKFENPDAEKNPDAEALVADRLKVRGSVWLDQGFHATGVVRFPGAEIGGQLNCKGGKFENPDAEKNPEADALMGNSLKVRGDVFLLDGFKTIGAVDLRNAKVGQLCDDERHWPAPGSLRLEGFVYSSLIPCEARERLRWLGLQPEFRTQPYEQLATVMRRMGEDQQAIRVLVQKNWELGKPKRAGVRGWLANRFLYITTRYGYNPALALVWLLGIVMLGYWGSHFAYRSGMIVPSSPPASGVLAQLKPPQSEFHASLYAVDALLPLDLGQQSQWQLRHTDNREYVGLQFLRLFYFLAAYLFAIIAGAGFSGLVRTE